MTNPPHKSPPGLTPLPESLPRLPPLPDETQSGASRGSEASLSRWSGFFAVVAWLSLLAAGVLVLAWSDQLATDPAGASALMSLAVLCVAGALSSFFFRALLRGAADVVRLLKKLNGLPYDGEL